MRFPAKAINSAVELLMQFFEVAADHVCQLDILKVMPATFVPGVEVRGVSWQELQPDLPACPGHELPNITAQ